MPVPDKLPEWASGANAEIEEPSQSKKEQGWEVEKPPHEVFNWLFNLIYQWFKWLTTQVYPYETDDATKHVGLRLESSDDGSDDPLAELEAYPSSVNPDDSVVELKGRATSIAPFFRFDGATQKMRLYGYEALYSGDWSEPGPHTQLHDSDLALINSDAGGQRDKNIEFWGKEAGGSGRHRLGRFRTETEASGTFAGKMLLSVNPGGGAATDLSDVLELLPDGAALAKNLPRAWAKVVYDSGTGTYSIADGIGLSNPTISSGSIKLDIDRALADGIAMVNTPVTGYVGNAEITDAGAKVTVAIFDLGTSSVVTDQDFDVVIYGVE